jgi:hypothetical protein
MQLNHRYREFCSRLDKAILKHGPIPKIFPIDQFVISENVILSNVTGSNNHYGIFLEAAPRGFTLAA